MKRKYTNRRYLDALEERIIIFDGAMGTSLQKQDLGPAEFGGEKYNGCNDYLVISYPQAVEKVHRSFLEVGVDVIETDTFRANRLTLGEYGLQDRTVEINRTAAQLARRLADEYAKKPASRALWPAPSALRANCLRWMTRSCPTSPSTSWRIFSASRPKDCSKAGSIYS